MTVANEIRRLHQALEDCPADADQIAARFAVDVLVKRAATHLRAGRAVNWPIWHPEFGQTNVRIEPGWGVPSTRKTR